MKIHFTPVFADFWALNLYAARRSFRFLIVFGTWALLLFLVQPMVQHAAHSKRSAYEIYRNELILLVFAALPIITLVLTYWSARRRWAKAPEVSVTRDMELSDEGLSVKSEAFESFIKWTVIAEAAVTKKFVYLKTAQRQYFFFPVACVPDMQELCDLLSAKVKVMSSASDGRVGR